MTNHKILCDTSTVSELLTGGSRMDGMRGLLDPATKAISVVTIGEMKAGALKANWGQRRLHGLEQHFCLYIQLGIDAATASAWAELKAVCLKRGTWKSDNDLWISATAVRHDYMVASLDRDFLDMPRIHLLPESGIPQRN